MRKPEREGWVSGFDTVHRMGPPFKVGSVFAGAGGRGWKIINSDLDLPKLRYILKQQEDLGVLKGDTVIKKKVFFSLGGHPSHYQM